MPRPLVSPIGEAKFAMILGEPRAYENSPDRTWQLDLVMDPADEACKAFEKFIQTKFEEIHGKTKKISKNGWPFKPDIYKNDEGEEIPTGKIKFKFKRKETNRDGIAVGAPKVVDAEKKDWDQSKLIGNGSLIKVAYSLFGWEMGGKGVSLRLEQVQVLKHEPYEPDVDVFSEEPEYVVKEPTAFDAGGVVSGEPCSIEDQLNKAKADAQTKELPF